MIGLFLAWKSAEPGEGWRPVARLDYDGEVYRFSYTGGARDPGFRLLPQLEKLDAVYESRELFPLFANRLLSPLRPEYDAFLRCCGFDPHHPPNPIAVLSVSEGRRETDEFEVFPCPQPDAKGRYSCCFFLHGIQWMPASAVDRMGKLEAGERLFVMPDPCNVADRHAVAVRTDKDRMLIGYVPRYLAPDIRQLLSQCPPEEIRLEVLQLNSDAPSRQRLLCSLNACWPEEFQPCVGPDFQTLAAIEPTCSK